MQRSSRRAHRLNAASRCDSECGAVAPHVVISDTTSHGSSPRSPQVPDPIPPCRSLSPPGEFYMPYPVEVAFGGATVFVLDVARHERL
jgi:hypothetical protein